MDKRRQMIPRQLRLRRTQPAERALRRDHRHDRRGHQRGEEEDRLNVRPGQAHPQGVHQAVDQQPDQEELSRGQQPLDHQQRRPRGGVATGRLPDQSQRRRNVS